MRFANFVSVLYSCASRAHTMFVLPHFFAKLGPPELTDDHLRIAKMCRDIYCESIESCDTFIASADTGAEATVRLDGSKAVVCFRGSSGAQDWKTNLQLSKIPFLSRKHKNPDLEVHSGLFIGHNSVKSKIYAKLNAIIKSGKCDSVLFTGHSAGGTLAVISAFDFQNLNNMPVDVVTFGSPKIGNAAFASGFDSKIKCTRIVNDNDGIALMPLFSDYRHVGKTIQLRNVEPKDGDAEGIWDALVNFAKLDSFSDHDMDSYIATMEAHLKKGQ